MLKQTGYDFAELATWNQCVTCTAYFISFVFASTFKRVYKIMAWLSQFSLVMRSSFTALREKVEAPERMLHQLIIDSNEEL